MGLFSSYFLASAIVIKMIMARSSGTETTVTANGVANPVHIVVYADSVQNRGATKGTSKKLIGIASIRMIIPIIINFLLCLGGCLVMLEIITVDCLLSKLSLCYYQQV